ncbi:MAG TPA: hypothetical protein PLB52_02705 [Candidatus Moranbacteria bacterium]|nr:hypothetical protein [Candidatus Moranbacteria bacterium]
MNRKQFLSEKVVGLILRVFASKEDDIPNRIKMIKDAISAARKMVVDGVQVIRRIDVLVWSDKNYKDSDCGKTAPALREALKEEKGVFVSEVEHADIFCAILNYGVVHQLRKGVDYNIIASAEAFSYMTPETMSDIINAACKGAKVIPVAITELTQSILEGRGANTFAMWDGESLMTVGGFDLKTAKPSDDRTAHYMKGWSQEKGDVYYQLAGVEEVIPIARMIQTFGACVAPIVPSGEGVKAYIVPDAATQPELWLRHISKMGTKFERQSAHLASIGVDPSYIKGGVMEEYRRF